MCSAKSTGIRRVCNGLGDDVLWTQDPTVYSPRHPQCYKVSWRDSGHHCQATFPAVPAEQPIFMDDNARPHRTRLVDTYKVWHNIDSLQWPSMSPDLNPIEHVWDALQKAVNAHQPPVGTLQELDMALHQGWNQMLQETCRNIVQLMSRRCQAVGWHTHYLCSCRASVNILMKVILGKIMICYETNFLPHLFSFKDFLLRSPSQWIETLCAFQNGHFFNVLFLMLYC